MARSHSIYQLIDTASGETIGMFTVKHEMQTARRNHPAPTRCLRYRDDMPYGPVTEVEETT